MRADREIWQGRASSREVVELANLRVSIFDVLEDFFGLRPPREGASWKGDCPFSFEHPDGGAERGFRTYAGTNTAYCFVQHNFMDPVRIIRIRNDCSAAHAARFLLDHYGLSPARDWRERFNQLSLERETRRTAMGNPASLVEALHEAARTRLGGLKQLDPAFQKAMEAELETLDSLLRKPGTEEQDIRAWYQAARERITRW